MSAAVHERDWRVDGLRAWGLLGVMVVNGVGYAHAPSGAVPLGAPLPLGSELQQALYAVAFFLFQGKAWPLLCFLFGYSMQAVAHGFRADGVMAKRALRQRHGKLLLLGVLHGALVYFGDVLTTYAICGGIAALWAVAWGAGRVRLSRLLTVWRVVGVIAAICLLLTIIWSFPAAGDLPLSGFWTARFGDVRSPGEFVALNLSYYLILLLAGSALIFPLYVWLMLSGMLVYRLRLLRPGHSASAFWMRWFGPGAWLLSTALSLLVTAMVMVLHRSQQIDYLTPLVLISLPVGTWWLFCALRWVLQASAGPADSAWGRALAWISPAGKYGLIMYLSLSCLLVGSLAVPVLQACFSSTGAALLTVGAWWLAWVALARWADRHQWRDPLSRWLNRSHQSARAKAVVAR